MTWMSEARVDVVPWMNSIVVVPESAIIAVIVASSSVASRVGGPATSVLTTDTSPGRRHADRLLHGEDRVDHRDEVGRRARRDELALQPRAARRLLLDVRELVGEEPLAGG
jgi:hypothetical protein